MATGIVEDLKCSDFSNNPRTTEFTKSFTANAGVSTTATQASYPAIPAGYIGVFSGFSTVTSVLLMIAFDANASGSGQLLGTRNITSAQNNKSCNFQNSLLSSDCVQDERNL